MKKVWFLGLLAAAILAGCSDNDDNGGDEVKPGGGQVESPYLPQRIAQVKVFKDGEESERCTFYYSIRGRMNLLREDDCGDMFSYFEDYLIESDDWFHNILNGKVITGYSYSGDDKVKYAYDGDYLQSLQWIETDRYGEYSDTLTMDFSFSEDNLSRYVLSCHYYGNQRYNNQRFQTDFKYGNRANELNIDMFYFIMRHVFRDLAIEAFGIYDSESITILEPWLLGIAGERSACLPESMEVTMSRESGDGEEKRAYTCKYTMKGEYVSEMAILDAAGKEAYRFVFSYEE